MRSLLLRAILHVALFFVVFHSALANVTEEGGTSESSTAVLDRLVEEITSPEISKAQLNETLLHFISALERSTDVGAAGPPPVQASDAAKMAVGTAALLTLVDNQGPIPPEDKALVANALRSLWIVSLFSGDETTINSAFSVLLSSMEKAAIDLAVAEIPNQYLRFLPGNHHFEESSVSVFIMHLSRFSRHPQVQGAMLHFLLKGIAQTLPEDSTLNAEIIAALTSALSGASGGQAESYQALSALDLLLAEISPSGRSQNYLEKNGLLQILSEIAGLGMPHTSAFSAGMLVRYTPEESHERFLASILLGLANRLSPGSSEISMEEQSRYYRAILSATKSVAGFEQTRLRLQALAAALPSQSPRLLTAEALVLDLLSILESIFVEPDNVRASFTSAAPDGCPDDPAKTEPGACGCGISDVDTDADGSLDCADLCPTDGGKIDPGICGCGVSDADDDNDQTTDCREQCPFDPEKTDAGLCGCGTTDADSDGDEVPDCRDECDNDEAKSEPGACGCGVIDSYSSADQEMECVGAEMLLVSAEVSDYAYNFSDIAVLTSKHSTLAKRRNALLSLNGKLINSLPQLRALGSALAAELNSTEMKKGILSVLAQSYRDLLPRSSSAEVLNTYLSQLRQIVTDSNDIVLVSMARRELQWAVSIALRESINERVFIPLIDRYGADPRPQEDRFRLYMLRTLAELLIQIRDVRGIAYPQQASQVVYSWPALPEKLLPQIAYLQQLSQGSDEHSALWAASLLSVLAFDLDIPAEEARRIADYLGGLAKSTAMTTELRVRAVRELRNGVGSGRSYPHRSSEEIDELTARTADHLLDVVDHGANYRFRFSEGAPFEAVPGRSERVIVEALYALSAFRETAGAKFFSLATALLALEPKPEIRGALLHSHFAILPVLFCDPVELISEEQKLALIQSLGMNLADSDEAITDAVLGTLPYFAQCSRFRQVLIQGIASFSDTSRRKFIDQMQSLERLNRSYTPDIHPIVFFNGLKRGLAGDIEEPKVPDFLYGAVEPFEQLVPAPAPVKQLLRRDLAAELFIRLPIRVPELEVWASEVLTRYAQQLAVSPELIKFPWEFFKMIRVDQVVYEFLASLEIGTLEQRRMKLQTLYELLKLASVEHGTQFRVFVKTAVENAAMGIEHPQVQKLLDLVQDPWWFGIPEPEDAR